MPLPTIPGVLRISVAGHVEGGGRWANTWHARNDSLVDFDAAAIAAFHAIFSQFYLGPAIGSGLSVMAHCSTGTTVDDFAYTPLDGSSGAFHFSTTFNGTGAGNAYPAECAEVLTVRTADRGRQNRGRVYLPCWSSSNFVSTGHLGSGSISSTLDQIAGVQTAVVTGGAHLGVASYGRSVNKAGVVHTWTPHFTNANQFTMDDLVDVQRRRKS